MTAIPSTLAECLRRAYNTGEYADLYISCGDEEIPAHQLIVCSQSEFFRAACLDKDGYRVPGAKIDLEHENVYLVNTMIEFLYFAEYSCTEDYGDDDTKQDYNDETTYDGDEGAEHGDSDDAEHGCDDGAEYDGDAGAERGDQGITQANDGETTKSDYDESTGDDDDEDNDNASDMVLHARMYVMASKYGIPALGDFARQYLEKAVNESWNATLFLESVPIIYDLTLDTDRRLRDLVVSHGGSHLQEFMKDVHLRARLQELFHSHPAFSWEVFQCNYDAAPMKPEELAAIVTPPSSNGSADDTTELVQDMKSCTCDESEEGLQRLEHDHGILVSPQGTRYSAALIQTNSAVEENSIRWMRVITPTISCPQHLRKWYFWSMFGLVSMMSKPFVKIVAEETLDAAIDRFERLFKVLSGLAWSNRNCRPKNGKYAYIEQSYQGIWLKQWPSRTIKDNAALVDRSIYRKKHDRDET